MEREEKRPWLRSWRDLGPTEWFILAWVAVFLVGVCEMLAPYITQ